MNDRPQTGDRLKLGPKIGNPDEEIIIGKSKGVCEVFECVDEEGAKGVIAFQFRTHDYWWIKKLHKKEPWEQEPDNG